MERLYALKFVLFWCAVFVIFVLVYFFVGEYRKWRRTKEMDENLYNMKYLWLQDAVRYWPVTEENYHVLCDHFIKLNQLKYKNKEKTTVLFVEEFLTKYQEVAR